MRQGETAHRGPRAPGGATALRASPCLSAGQRRADHDRGENCGLVSCRHPAANSLPRSPHHGPGAGRETPPFPLPPTSPRPSPPPRGGEGERPETGEAFAGLAPGRRRVGKRASRGSKQVVRRLAPGRQARTARQRVARSRARGARCAKRVGKRASRAPARAESKRERPAIEGKEKTSATSRTSPFPRASSSSRSTEASTSPPRAGTPRGRARWRRRAGA